MYVCVCVRALNLRVSCSVLMGRTEAVVPIRDRRVTAQELVDPVHANSSSITCTPCTVMCVCRNVCVVEVYVYVRDGMCVYAGGSVRARTCIYAVLSIREFARVMPVVAVRRHINANRLQCSPLTRRPQACCCRTWYGHAHADQVILTASAAFERDRNHDDTVDDRRDWQ